MDTRKLWAVSDDGEIEYISLTSKYLEDSMVVMRESFFKHETVSIACELHTSPKGIKELEELSLNAARDGVSVIAVEKATDKVIGVSFNKMQFLNSDQSTYFETYIAGCKEDSSKALIQFMIDADGSCNLFDSLKIECLLEMMFMATLPQFRKRGICSALTQTSIDIARAINEGKFEKISITDGPVPPSPKPQAVSAIYTSFITQKIGRKFNFTIAANISYEKFSYKNKTFAERIDPTTPSTTVEYLLL